MAIAFTDVSTTPDIISSHLHQLQFSSLPGVNGDRLTLLHTHITVPALGVGHIRKKILGYSLGFRGGQSFENVLSCSFYENSKGETFKSLLNWLNLTRNYQLGTSGTKITYATNAEMSMYDTTGALVYKFKLVNVFPLSIDFPEFAEESTAAEYHVNFNVDMVVLKNTVLAVSGDRQGVNLTPEQRGLSIPEFASQYSGYLG